MGDYRERGHPNLTDCERERGFWLYKRESDDEWVAFRTHRPVEGSGATREEALTAAKDAMDDRYKEESAYWDMWQMECPDCSPGNLTPLQSSVDDRQDRRVKCSNCKEIFHLRAIPSEETV